MAEDLLLNRRLPCDLDAESSVLGAMLMDEEAIDIAAEILTGEDFYAKANGVVFDAMVQLRAEGRPADMVTLSARLKENGAPEEITDADRIREILKTVPTSANIKAYAQIVYEKSTLRRLIRVMENEVEACYGAKGKLDDILEHTEKEVFDVLQKRNSREYTPINEIVKDVLGKIEEAATHKGYVTGLSTGFKDLDFYTAGLQNSDFILVAARPSMGKTAFALSLAGYAAFKENLGVAVFSLEMSKEQLTSRLLAMESRVDAQNIRTGNLNDEEWESIMDSTEVIGRSKIIIDDTPGISVSELRSKCRKYKLENDIRLVVIDYIQLMSSGNRVESRQQELSDISRSLKAIARELNIPVVVLSQLNRAADSRADHKPVLSDIRESGAIEQDADLIMFIYRDDYYNPESEKKNIAEIIIAKQRNGPVGTVELMWQPKYTRFVGIEKHRP